MVRIGLAVFPAGIRSETRASHPRRPPGPFGTLAIGDARLGPSSSGARAVLIPGDEPCDFVVAATIE